MTSCVRRRNKRGGGLRLPSKRAHPATECDTGVNLVRPGERVHGIDPDLMAVMVIARGTGFDRKRKLVVTHHGVPSSLPANVYA